MSCTIATIGVYGFDATTFLEALKRAEVDVVVDVRQRRGVRGAEYAWANSRRLQAALTDAGLDYLHMKELAPTTEMRRLQYREDARKGEGKRSRSTIAESYVDAYTEEILEPADLSSLLALARHGTPALLCVERDAEACHRSLIAGRLERESGCEAIHIRPREPQPGVSDRVSRGRTSRP